MALLPCPECSRETSTRAVTCPHCGCPVAETVVADARRAGVPDVELRELLALPPPPVPRAPVSPGLGVCDRCGSDDVRAIPLVYEEGTHHIQTQGRTTGAALGPHGVAVGRATTHTTGTQQAMLAARLAPPMPRDGVNVVAAGLALIGGIAALVGGHLLGGRLGVFVGFVLALVGIGGAWVLGAFHDAAVVRFNAHDLPRLRAVWRRSVLCMRCGAVTDPVADRG